MDSLLTPVEAEHAEALYPMVKDSPVTATILWDGPESLAAYRAGLAEREASVKAGTLHMFTIVDPETGKPAGSIDIRPEEGGFRADIGLWIGVPFHGRGLGTRAVRAIARYGFENLGLAKIEGKIFVGNEASRRAFEKAGFRCEGTLRRCAMKRGRLVDEWVMGILPEELPPEI
ncbi:MAG: GNAT family N-acetyltransferase [Bdellovibrionales bacterium]|nr:GNAT family N-acetyltransferase [Bdellovibrionales bacterium]